MNIKIKNFLKIASTLFCVVFISFLFSFNQAKAQCTPTCTGSQTCQVDTETGKYYCVSGGISGPDSQLGEGITGPTSSQSPIVFENPLRFETVEGFLQQGILPALQGIIIVLSIIFIVLGGIFYITSAGNENRMKVAKGTITASLIGLAIGIAAPSFLKEIYTMLGTKSGSGVSMPEGPTLTEISLNFLDFLLSITGVVALIMLIIGGIMYLTSAGNEDRIKTAKKIVTYAIIGITVALASLVIVKQIANLLK